MAVNAAANRALAPEASKLLELEVIHIDLGETQNGCVAGAAPHGGRRKDTQEPSHAVTYASCQGLTLHNRVRLDLESCHLTLRHLYVGASRATSSELLEAA